MDKRIVFTEAEEDIYKLFSPNGYIPKSREVRAIIKWVYNWGTEHGAGKERLNLKNRKGRKI